jgi:flagellar hook protein FlgE
MGISSALNAGVMGLGVNATKLATISDNIANSETKGYKRADVTFSSLVLTESETRYDAGGVRATPTRDVDNRGALLSTRNGTDLAISGAGFFPVTDTLRAEGTDFPLKLTTTGSFRPDDQGTLRTPTGFALLGYPADENGVVNVPNRESAAALRPVQIENLALASDPTTALTLAVNLPADDTLDVTATQYQLPVEYFDNLGGSQTLTLNFDYTPAAGPTAVPNTWTVDILDSAQGNASIYNATLVFDDTAGNGGELLSLTPNTAAAGTVAFDGTTGVVGLQVASGQIDLNLGRLGTAEGLLQLSTDFTPINIDKNGSPAATITGIDITDEGFVEAIFDSGFRRTLYQIPVGAVPNPNGLRALDGQAFSITRQSGPIYFYDAGSGPTGAIVSSALEESTTDIAQELTQLIKTQRAYSSNAKIIQTVDEMLQETTNLKR